MLPMIGNLAFQIVCMSNDALLTYEIWLINFQASQRAAYGTV